MVPDDDENVQTMHTRQYDCWMETTLGTFEVTGDKLLVTDPCYERGTWCAGVVKNVRPGTWVGVVRYSDEGLWGTRVRQVEAHYIGSNPSDSGWTMQQFDVGVDSGQAGIFDEARYPNGEPGEYGDASTFYGRACEATLGRDDEESTRRRGNVISEGVVVSSGYGDGSYVCEAFDGADGKVVAVRITFIGDDEEYDGEDYEEDDDE